MKIAFLAETFHTEVLQYLIELHKEKYEILIYNNFDKYDNISYYREKYNVEVKPLGQFLNDLFANAFVKCYMISFDNVIIPEMLEEYKSKLIYLAHSKDHLSLFARNGLQFISLTPQLCLDYHVNFMLPIVRSPLLKQSTSNTQSTSVMCIGDFTPMTKDVKVIQELLNNNVKMHVFSRIKSQLVDECLQRYPDNFFFYFQKTTKEILNVLHLVGFILFCPPKESDYFKHKWSGCIAFAYNNDIPLIAPHDIAQLYNLSGHVEYNSSEPDLHKLINTLQLYNNDYSSNKNLMQSFRERVFSRNELIRSIILEEPYDIPTVTCTMSEFGAIFLDGTDPNDTKGPIIVRHYYPEKDLLKALALSNEAPTILVVGSYIGVSPLTILNINKKSKVLSFERNCDKAKMQKRTLMLNNCLSRAHIYNNILGHKLKRDIILSCLNGLVDMLTIDALRVTQLDVIKIEEHDMTEVILVGGRRTIEKHHPVIVYPNVHASLTEEQKEILEVDEHVTFFDVSKYLTSIGYNKSKVQIVDNNVVWTW